MQDVLNDDEAPDEENESELQLDEEPEPEAEEPDETEENPEDHNIEEEEAECSEVRTVGAEKTKRYAKHMDTTVHVA